MQLFLEPLIRLDLLLESIAGLIAFAISHYANTAYRLTEQKRLSDLSTGFLVLSAAMFGRVLGTVYLFVIHGGQPEGNSALLLASVVSIAYGVMKIMAYLLFAISTRPAGNQYTKTSFLLLAIPALVDPNLDLIAIIVLIVVVLQSLMNYASTRSRFALYVLVGFSLLLLSHVAGIAAQIESRAYLSYIMSQLFQFLGFIALLLMLIKAGK